MFKEEVETIARKRKLRCKLQLRSSRSRRKICDVQVLTAIGPLLSLTYFIAHILPRDILLPRVSALTPRPR
jgi:hypothetical protein